MIDMEDIEALEEELQKIQVFGRELPLSLHLVRQTIESIKKQRKMQRDMPVLEEFMPLKPSLSSVKEGINHHEDNKKMNWLQSVQLWNQEHDVTLIEIDKKKKEKENISQPHKKARRCWSAELHRSFLDALQQLGGSHAATPKQIRELMKVDGLTNDEIKSHLQKYRLHTRRSSTAVQRNFDFLSLCDKNSMASLRSPITIFGPKSTILEHGPKNFPFRADN